MEAANKTNEAIIDEQISLENTDRYIEDTLDEMVTLQSNGSYDENKGMNTPYLKDGMIPVKWNGTNWVKTVGSDKEWYDYSKKMWANVVINGVFDEEGVLDENSSYSMFVWIPRYAYSITSGYHQSGEEINSSVPTHGAVIDEVHYFCSGVCINAFYDDYGYTCKTYGSCSTCEGDGQVSTSKQCTTCGGDGKVTKYNYCGHGYANSHYWCAHGNDMGVTQHD